MTQRHLSFLHCYRLSDEMDPKVLDAIADFMNANKVSYKWQKVIILQVTVLFFFLSNLPAETVFPPYGFFITGRHLCNQQQVRADFFMTNAMFCTIPYPPLASIGLTDLSCIRGIRLRGRGEFMHPCLAIFSGQTWQKGIVLER